ncbi:hypothetical protein PsYK624_026790 [Phanerochaete sordida]|uniref:Uncharacterized protein n=1 Tax=Phanerochaete sordida TaxID=48140 RepID=A0A9P3G2S5_9APHY|nr:hypothetical protein PsYK624_026790 [Phanerochaete sordida]
MSNSAGITDQRHNDYVGSDANVGRIPGAEKATTGHHYVEIFPKEGAPKQSHGERRPDEHLPPPTGRGGLNQSAHAEQGAPTERFTTARHQDAATQFQRQQPQPLAPAPDSRTVVDTDPYDAPVTAGDTLTGATSQTVYQGLGVPGKGMSSAEMHHDGHPHSKRGHLGSDQYGTADTLRSRDGVDLDGWK